MRQSALPDTGWFCTLSLPLRFPDPLDEGVLPPPSPGGPGSALHYAVHSGRGVRVCRSDIFLWNWRWMRTQGCAGRLEPTAPHQRPPLWQGLAWACLQPALSPRAPSSAVSQAAGGSPVPAPWLRTDARRLAIGEINKTVSVGPITRGVKQTHWHAAPPATNSSPTT